METVQTFFAGYGARSQGTPGLQLVCNTKHRPGRDRRGLKPDLF